MLRLASYDIVFQEVPGEITLALNLAGCPHRCRGCHSPHLREDRGEVLDEEALRLLLATYREGITCVCFMGGDASPKEVERLAGYLSTNHNIKTAWYSGRNHLPDNLSLTHFNFIKLGPYIEHLGGLDSPTTNQQFYRIDKNMMIDITFVFQQKNITSPKESLIVPKSPEGDFRLYGLAPFRGLGAEERIGKGVGGGVL